MAYRFGIEDARRILTLPGAHDSKYTRGVIALLTGSEDYPGAAILGVEGAARTGAGYVRYFGPQQCQDALLARRPETVFGVNPQTRADAWVMGSGFPDVNDSLIGAERFDLVYSLITQVCEFGEKRGDDSWLVIDAGVLEFFASRVKESLRVDSLPCVVTPHSGEAARMLSIFGHRVTRVEIEGDPQYWAEILAQDLHCVVVLKGSRTIIACRGVESVEVSDGTHWLATAGTGDVLAGIMGTIVAQSVTGNILDTNAPATAVAVCAAAVMIHSLAGALAASDMQSVETLTRKQHPRGAMFSQAGHPIVASDVAAFISTAMETILDATYYPEFLA